jgi:hypothetical protein
LGRVKNIFQSDPGPISVYKKDLFIHKQGGLGLNGKDNDTDIITSIYVRCISVDSLHSKSKIKFSFKTWSLGYQNAQNFSYISKILT